MASINILHVSSASSFRGGEQQVYYLIKSLEKHNAKQTLICPSNAYLKEKLKNKSINLVSVNKPGLYSLLQTIKETCFEQDIQIIHAHDSKAHTAVVLSVFKNRLNVKVIITRRVIFPVSGYLSKLKYQTKIVSKIICVSEGVKEEMLNVVPSKKLKVISSAIDVNKFEVINRTPFSFFKDTNIKVAYVAALTFEKDHKTFLNTASLILEKNKNITFYIVGQGKLRKDILALIEKMNLQNNIVLTGFISDISSLIPQFDYLLFTSKSEGLGTTILDFYLAKKPVVTTLCGGNKEISVHEKTAMVSRVGDANSLANNFLSLLADKNLENKIVSNASKLILEKFTSKILAYNTYKEYKNLLINSNKIKY